MTKQHLQTGSGHVVLFAAIFVAIVGALGFVGYNALQRQNANAGGENLLGSEHPILTAKYKYNKKPFGYTQDIGSYSTTSGELTQVKKTFGEYPSGLSYAPNKSKAAWLSYVKSGKKYNVTLNLYSVSTGQVSSINISSLKGAPKASEYVTRNLFVNWLKDSENVALAFGDGTYSSYYTLDTSSKKLELVASKITKGSKMFNGGVVTGDNSLVYVVFNDSTLAQSLYKVANGSSKKLIDAPVSVLKNVPGTESTVSYSDNDDYKVSSKIRTLKNGMSPEILFDAASVGESERVAIDDFEYSSDGTKIAVQTTDNTNIEKCNKKSNFMYEATRKLVILDSQNGSVVKTPYTETANITCGGRGAAGGLNRQMTAWSDDNNSVAFISKLYTTDAVDVKFQVADLASDSLKSVSSKPDSLTW